MNTDTRSISRRTALSHLAGGGLAIAGWALLSRQMAYAAPLQAGDEVIPWLDQPAENPVPQVIANQLVWENLDSWITPNEEFFSIAHYNRPVIDAKKWQLQVTGLVKKPLTLTLDQIKARPRQEVTYTLECSGNTGLPFFWGGIGNAKWAGTPLAPILKEAGVLDNGVEAVFWGADAGEETVREVKMMQNFARSMSLADAMNPNNLLAYEMNGAALPAPNGFPLRLIAPGWYGIANVKWLKGIEVRDTRFMNRFMARDYVTIRKEDRKGETVWTETSVGRALLKSAPARVVKNGSKFTIQGAAWGAPIQKVEVKVDNGPWVQGQLDTKQTAPDAWVFWTLDWSNPKSGEHTITTRATDKQGNVQSAADDPRIANKQTYWESNGQITRKVKV
jgi:DMSO/TMAO reductase YedYZ molybdopterin-dependent catalytic subunit